MDDKFVYVVLTGDRNSDEQCIRGVFTRQGPAQKCADRLLATYRFPETWRVVVESWPALSELPDEFYPPGGDVVYRAVGPTVIDAGPAQRELETD